MDWFEIIPQSPTEYLVDLRTSNQPQFKPLEAAINTIFKITSKYPPPYTLMLSGGVDSQAMLWAWHLSGVKYKTCCVTYNENMNEHDLQHIGQFAAMLNIPLEYKNVDVLAFLRDDYDEWANRYNCSSPQICTHMKMIEDIEGTVIFSGNFMEPTTAFISYTTMGISRYAAANNKSIVPFFFMETQALAMALIPFYLELDISSGYKLSGYDRKVQAYINAGFPVIKQPEKLSGFEVIKDHYDAHYAHTVSVNDKLRAANKPSKRTFDRLLRYPYELKLGNPSFKILTNFKN